MPGNSQQTVSPEAEAYLDALNEIIVQTQKVRRYASQFTDEQKRRVLDDIQKILGAMDRLDEALARVDQEHERQPT